MALEKKYYSGAQVFDSIKELPGKEFLSMLNTFAKERGADVVEVVRCKDCIHRNRIVNAKLSNGEEWESVECDKHKMLVTEDWFCADGKRRENGIQN